MLTSPPHLLNLDDLRIYVNETLCNFNQLESGVFPLRERILLRGGSPCGIFFSLHGPGSQRLTAIWETDSNAVLFYGADGQRFLKTQLSTATSLQLVAS